MYASDHDLPLPLPEDVYREFWEQSAVLRNIYTNTAYAGSPWAILAHILPRVASHIPAEVTAADGGTLNFASGVVGHSGCGFSLTKGCAEVFCPGNNEWPDGTWAGFARSLDDFGVATAAFDSGFGLALDAIAEESDPDCGPKALRHWMVMLDGKAKRHPNGRLNAGAYRFAIAENIYFSPHGEWYLSPLARSLRERYLFAPLLGGPGVKDAGFARSRDALTLPAEWTPGPIYARDTFIGSPLRHRVAALLAALHGRTFVTLPDWENAAVVVSVSDHFIGSLINHRRLAEKEN